MIASLPMYLRDENRAAYDRLWTGIRTALAASWPDLPDQLTQAENPWDHWRARDLLLSQTCGLPYARELHDKVTLIGTPDYHLPGCAPGYYTSVFVMHRDMATDDPAAWEKNTIAVNDLRSQSGWAAPRAFMAARGLAFTKAPQITGAHRASARAVAERRADIAAIDAQTWRMIRRWDRWSDNLTEVARTTPTPGLPLITAQPGKADDLFAAIRHQITALSDEDRALLDLHDLVHIPKSAYLAPP